MMIIVKNEIFCIKNITLSLGFSVNCYWNQRCNHIEVSFFFFFGRLFFSWQCIFHQIVHNAWLSLFWDVRATDLQSKGLQMGLFFLFVKYFNNQRLSHIYSLVISVYFLQKRQDKYMIFFSFNYLLQNTELISQHLQKGSIRFCVGGHHFKIMEFKQS